MPNGVGKKQQRVLVSGLDGGDKFSRGHSTVGTGEDDVSREPHTEDSVAYLSNNSHLYLNNQKNVKLFDSRLESALLYSQAKIETGYPYYMKRCSMHLEDGKYPDQHECTFSPALVPPLGAKRLRENEIYRPVLNVKHSMTTKSSVKYHYKRLQHAREGPEVYRERPESVGGGPYYKRKV